MPPLPRERSEHALSMFGSNKWLPWASSARQALDGAGAHACMSTMKDSIPLTAVLSATYQRPACLCCSLCMAPSRRGHQSHALLHGRDRSAGVRHISTEACQTEKDQCCNMRRVGQSDCSFKCWPIAASVAVCQSIKSSPYAYPRLLAWRKRGLPP